MLQYEHGDTTFAVFPECHSEDYEAASHDSPVITGYYGYTNAQVLLIDKGKIIDRRLKTRLTTTEIDHGFTSVGMVRSFNFNDLKILPIICYEICFPEDYYHLEDIDFITHHIGLPMYDRHQYIAWVALQKAASQHFKCPVVSVCGGEAGALNPTGVIYP